MIEKSDTKDNPSLICTGNGGEPPRMNIDGGNWSSGMGYIWVGSQKCGSVDLFPPTPETYFKVLDVSFK